MFLPKERDLIKATAVCRHWRTVLLSFPRLWSNVSGLSPELEAYLERSKSVPISVNLFHPQLAASVVPHASRLISLTVLVEDSAGFEEVAEILSNPIPTLHSFGIFNKNSQLHTLELPSGLYEGLFLHLKSLYVYGVPSLRGFQTFPHITELSFCTSSSFHTPLPSLLNSLRLLPGLVKLSMRFQDDWCTTINIPADTVTLPRVREVFLSEFSLTGSTSEGAIPHILQYLNLPSTTMLTLQSGFPGASICALPISHFAERLPNYRKVPDMFIEVDGVESAKVTFQSPSQAVLVYDTTRLKYFTREHQLWGGLPLSSVRRVTAVILNPTPGNGLWLVGLLWMLKELELLKLSGYCGVVLRFLRREMVRGTLSVVIDTLVVDGGESAKGEVRKLEDIKGTIGLQDMKVTFILQPMIRELYHEGEGDTSTDYDSSSDEGNLSEGDDDEEEYGLNESGDDEEEEEEVLQ